VELLPATQQVIHDDVGRTNIVAAMEATATLMGTLGVRLST
jgi:hypothetical protein